MDMVALRGAFALLKSAGQSLLTTAYAVAVTAVGVLLLITGQLRLLMSHGLFDCRFVSFLVCLGMTHSLGHGLGRITAVVMSVLLLIIGEFLCAAAHIVTGVIVHMSLRRFSGIAHEHFPLLIAFIRMYMPCCSSIGSRCIFQMHPHFLIIRRHSDTFIFQCCCGSYRHHYCQTEKDRQPPPVVFLFTQESFRLLQNVRFHCAPPSLFHHARF